LPIYTGVRELVAHLYWYKLTIAYLPITDHLSESDFLYYSDKNKQFAYLQCCEQVNSSECISRAELCAYLQLVVNKLCAYLHKFVSKNCLSIYTVLRGVLVNRIQVHNSDLLEM